MQRVLALEVARRSARAAGGGHTRRLCGAVASARIALREDERLARRVARGSTRAVAALSSRYSEQLYAYCYLLLRDTDLAYEALQATLARAVRALRLGGGEGFLRPWLFRIARDEASALLRAGVAVRTSARHLPQPPRGLLGSRDERARLALLAGDLHVLPELQRSALLMRELGGLSHREIGAALEITPQSVKQAIFHARRALGELEQGRSLACEEVRRTISHGDGRQLRRRTVSSHLRSCSACAAFAAAIPSRSADLQALVPPLAPALAAGLLAHLLAGGTAPPAGGLLSGLAGKSAGAGLAGKTALAAAVAVTAGGGLAVSALVHPRSQVPRARGGVPFALARQLQTPTGTAQRHTAERGSPAGRRADPAPGRRMAAGTPQPAGRAPDAGSHAARADAWPRPVPTAAAVGTQAFVFKRRTLVPVPAAAPPHRVATTAHRSAAPGVRRRPGVRQSHLGRARAEGHERGRPGVAGERPPHAGPGHGRDSAGGRRAVDPAAPAPHAAGRAGAPAHSNAAPAANVTAGATPATRATPGPPAAPAPGSDRSARPDAAHAETAPAAGIPAGGQLSPEPSAAHGANGHAAAPQASSPSA